MAYVCKSVRVCYMCHEILRILGRFWCSRRCLSVGKGNSELLSPSLKSSGRIGNHVVMAFDCNDLGN